MNFETTPEYNKDKKEVAQEKHTSDISDTLLQNINDGTYLSWNGGLNSIEEYLNSSDLEHRELKGEYVRLIVDRLNFFRPSDMQNIAGALADAKTVLENAGVIIARPIVEDLPQMHGRQRDIDQAELDSVEKETAALREIILSQRHAHGSEIYSMVQESLKNFNSLGNEVIVRGLTEYEYKRLFCALAKDIFKNSKEQ